MEDIILRQEEEKEKFHKFLIQMARDQVDGKLKYKDVEEKIVNYWLSRHKQSVIEILKGLIKREKNMKAQTFHEYSIIFNEAKQDTISNLENIISKMK